MEYPHLDPETLRQLFQTLLVCLAWFLWGSALLGVGAYLVFLCRELFSPRPPSKARAAKLPEPMGWSSVNQPVSRECIGTRAKVEVATNVALITLACLAGYRFWQARRTPGNPPPAWVKVGDQLPDLPAYQWKGHDHTLLLALRNECRFCDASIPFYRKLAALEKSNQTDAHLIAVFPEDLATVRRLVETQLLAVETLAGVELSQVKVEGTPTLLLVDRQGRVSKVWIGELASAGQAEVVEAIHKAGAKPRWSLSWALPPL